MRTKILISKSLPNSLKILMGKGRSSDKETGFVNFVLITIILLEKSVIDARFNSGIKMVICCFERWLSQLRVLRGLKKNSKVLRFKSGILKSVVHCPRIISTLRREIPVPQRAILRRKNRFRKNRVKKTRISRSVPLVFLLTIVTRIKSTHNTIRDSMLVTNPSIFLISRGLLISSNSIN